MIRCSVTVSLVAEARGGPFVFWDDLEAACQKAKALGFDGIEIFPPSAEALHELPVRALLQEHGLALAAVGTGAGWVKQRLHLCLPDAAARTQARTFIRSIIDAAGTLQAPAIIGSMQGRHGDGVDLQTAVGYLLDAVEELGEHARQYQVPLLLEPLNRYETNLLNTMADGMQLLRRLSTPNVKLLADLFHMNIEEAQIEAGLRLGGPHIGHLHFVDSNRRAAGMGHLDYAPIVRTLHEIGYRSFASVEAFPYPNPDDAARQTIVAFRTWFPQAGRPASS
jgi:sugar phosphate isomerase/epimerase